MRPSAGDARPTASQVYPSCTRLATPAAARIEEFRGPGYTLSDIASNLSIDYPSAQSYHRSSGRTARRWKEDTGTDAPIELVDIAYEWDDEEQGMRTRYQLPPGVAEAIENLA